MHADLQDTAGNEQEDMLAREFAGSGRDRCRKNEKYMYDIGLPVRVLNERGV